MLISLISFLIFSLILIQHTIGQLIEHFDKFQSRCEINNPQYWKITNWYMDRSSFVTITSISETENHFKHYGPIVSFFSSASFNTVFPVVILPAYLNDPLLWKFPNIFTWEGKRFPNSPNSTHDRRFTRRKKRTTATVSASPTVLSPTIPGLSRRDESEHGTIVTVENITIINLFLNGPPRKPFLKPRKYYILTLRKISDNWRTEADLVLVKLWKEYGIVNVILMAPCMDSGEPVIATYFPFELNTSIELPDSRSPDSYGQTKWIPLHEFDYNDNILRKFHNLNGFPFCVSIFERYPTALTSDSVPEPFRLTHYSRGMKYSNGFTGFDGLVLGNLAQALNFRAIIIAPFGNDYGYKSENGTFIGSLGDVLRSNAQISVNGRFISDYGTKDIEYLFPVFFDKFCIIAPKALRVPDWMAIFKCFDPSVWSLVVAINFFCGYFWYLLKQWAILKYKRKIIKRKRLEKFSKSNNSCEVVSIDMWIIMLAGTSTKMPIRTIERLFMTTCLVANIIIVGSFQGSLTTSFSTQTYYKDIDTLEELDKSGLMVGTTSGSLKDIFAGGGTHVLQSLMKKFIVDPKSEPMILRTVKYRDICCIERLADIGLIIANLYELSDGTVLLHAIKECPRTIQISYIVKSGWPYMPAFNYIIQRLTEAGLLLEWYHQVEYSMVLHERYSRWRLENNTRVFTLVDVQTAFYILGIGLLVCILVFCIECMVGSSNNNNNYNNNSNNNNNHVMKVLKTSIKNYDVNFSKKI